MSEVISKHNKQIISKNTEQEKSQKTCNCRRPTECPLQNRCLEQSLIYQATVSSKSGEKKYIGCTEGPFKTRFNNHKQSMNKRSYSSATELSKYVWNLKDRDENFDISWKIVAKASPYICGSKKCDICLTEKVFIADGDPVSLLNSRAEIISKCRHLETSFYLAN